MIFQLNKLRNLAIFLFIITDGYNNCIAIGICPECFKTHPLSHPYIQEGQIYRKN